MKETVSLAEITVCIKKTWKQSLLITLGSGIIALILAFIIPAQYQSSVLLQAKQAKSSLASLGGAGSDLLGALGMGQQTSPKEYIEIMQSRSVLQPIIEEMADLTAEEKQEMTVEKFFKKYVELNNPKGTNIIELTVTGKTPEEAQFIAGEIAKNLKQVLTTTGQSDNSYLKNFFETKLKSAEDDMEQSEKKLLAFSQSTKVFAPESQSEGIVNAFTEVEKKKAESTVSLDVSKVKLSEVNRQLAKQNVALNQYNMTDNPSIENIRQNIITKELEILKMKQTFTEKHPNVILAREQLDALKNKLTAEVSKAVASQTMTLNPVQGELIKQKVMTEAEVLGYQAEETALNQIETKLDQDLSSFSQNTSDFVALKRQAVISQEIYLALRKQYEQFKVQEAKDSLDIAVIDQADLPYKPAFPKKSLFLAAGLVLGFFGSLGKVLYQAFKQ